jgi:hypothetical protein
MDKSRLKAFEARYDVILLHPLGLGPGQDGIVLQSNRRTAVKFFDQTGRFRRELEVYQTLRAKGIQSIGEGARPSLRVIRRAETA